MIELASGAKSVILPAGTYVISDPCYHVPDSAWSDLLDDCGFFEKQCHGKFLKADGTYGTVVAFSTMYGDGVYWDENRREYGVDAGLIGIMSADDVEFDPVLGHLVKFKSDFECYESGGTIYLGKVEINTADTSGGGDEDEDDDDADDVRELGESYGWGENDD